MSLCQLLRDHIDELWRNHKANYKDIAKVLDMNVSSIRTGVYNDQLGFDKFCKVAIVCGFPLMRYAGELLTRYPKDVKDLEDAKMRVQTYSRALKDKILLTFDDNEAYKQAFDEALKESNEDTASLVMLAKMRSCVGTDKQPVEDGNTLKDLTRMQGTLDEHSKEHIEIESRMKKVENDYNEKVEQEEPVKIPVPVNLESLVEAIVEHESENTAVNETGEKGEERKTMSEEKTAENVKQAAAVEVPAIEKEKNICMKVRLDHDGFPEARDVVRPILDNMKGFEAVVYWETFRDLWNYGETGDIRLLESCIDNMQDLFKEANITPEALG